MRRKSRIPNVTAVINRSSFNDRPGAKGSYESIFSSIRASWSSNSAISARCFATSSAASGLGSKHSIASSSALSLPNFLRRLSASLRHLFNSRLLTLPLDSSPQMWGLLYPARLMGGLKSAPLLHSFRRRQMNNTIHHQSLRLIFCALAGVSLAFAALLRHTNAQSGALIPVSVKNEPDPSILSLQVMKVDVEIDNQHARVKVLQIFDSHTDQVLEGKYLFALPSQSSIADFAVWDGDLRLPGVILEKRRADQIYSEIKNQEIDPGLLQQDDEHGGTSAFSAKVFPIPAYGSKRVELEYTETLPVGN